MCLLAELGGPSVVFLLALIATIGILLMRSHRYFSRQRHAPTVRIEPARPPRRGLGANGPDEAARWEVEMHETARELSAQLDSKMGALAHLIREADRAATRLEKALADVDDQHGPDRQEPTIPTPPTPRGSQAEGLASPVPVPPAAGDADGNQTEDSPGVAERDRRRQEIYTLADYGFQLGEIARRVGTPIGEVQLILDLRPKR